MDLRGRRTELYERQARLLEEAVPGPGGCFRVHDFQQPTAVLSAAEGAPLRLRGTIHMMRAVTTKCNEFRDFLANQTHDFDIITFISLLGFALD